MNTKHTPGPWTALRASVISGPFVICPRVHAGARMSIDDSCAAAEANARLIAAAPELLAALEDCREALRRAGADGELRVVDAAIAKARGGA